MEIGDRSSGDDDLDFMPVLASMPPDQTVFEYLVGCWRRQHAARTALHKKVRPVFVFRGVRCVFF